jgi:predicted permease
MRTIRGWWDRLRAWNGERERDFGEEMESVVQMHMDEYLSAGLTSEEARRRALIEVGGIEQVRQAVRNGRGLQWLEGWARDVKYAIRALRRTPGFSVVAITVMAIGIGASVSLFTVVRSVLLRPLPFPHPDRLIALYSHDRRSDNLTASGDFYDWQKASHGYEQMAIWRWTGYNMSSSGAELPEFVNAGTCSWNLFATLGVGPGIGRLFTPADDHPGADRTVILSWSFYNRRFNGNPAVLGKTIRLNSLTYTVTGVLPDWFQYPDPKIQMWVPWQVGVPPGDILTHYNHIGHIVARLRQGVSASAALQEVSAVEHRLYLEYRATGPMEEDASGEPLLEDVVGDAKTPLYVLLAAVICLLLIACLNLSNLLVARSAMRRRETAIRSALGGTRLSLMRQQVIESLLICVSGGTLGVLLAVAATRWLVRHWAELPRGYDIHPDGLAIGFALGITLLAGVLAGLLPAISSTGGGALLAALQEGSRGIGGSIGRASLRKALLTAEIALTVILLVTAGLLFKSFLRLRSADIGCTTKNVLTMTYFLRGDRYSKPEQIVNFDTRLLDKVRHLPGVEAAGLTNVVPGDGYYGDHEIWIPEHPPQASGVHRFAAYRTADPGYFSTMEIPLLQGRFFSEDERLERDKFVIVNEELVKQDFPGEDPVGRHLRVEWRTPQGESYEIVGVVANTIYELGKPIRPMMWFPILSGIPGNSGDSVLVVRSEKDVTSLAMPIQRMISSLDAELPVKNVLTMEQMVGRSTANSDFSATLVLSFAGFSLLLAAIGLYGVLAYLVTQRTGEIGIRMALGAEREQVMRLVLFDGLRPALVGLGIGIVGSLAATHLISAVLYGTSPLDASVFLSVIATLLASATAACLVPAWRAARIDPICALRAE